MKKFNSTEFYDLLIKENIDFVANATSHWHAVAIDAFLCELSTRLNRKLDGIILVYPNLKDGFVITEKDFSCNKFLSNVDYYSIDERTQTKKILIRSKNFIFDFINTFINTFSGDAEKKIYLIFPDTSPTCLFKKIFKIKKLSRKYLPIEVQVEEGIGTYISKNTQKRVTKRYLSKSKTTKYSLFENMILELKYLIQNNLVILDRKILLRNLKTEKKHLLKEKAGIFSINKDVSSYYQQVLKIRERNIMYRKGECVLIITDPLSEYKTVSLEEELELIEEIIKVSIDCDFKVFLKPHPRENKDKYSPILKKYEFNMISQNFPVEEVIPSINPSFLVGYGSTAMINAKIFYNINSISLINMTTMNKKNSFQEFRKITKEYVTFIDQIEDLKEYLDTHIQSKSINNTI